MEGNGGHPLSASLAEETPSEAPPPYESFIEETKNEDEENVSKEIYAELVNYFVLIVPSHTKSKKPALFTT